MSYLEHALQCRASSVGNLRGDPPKFLDSRRGAILPARNSTLSRQESAYESTYESSGR